MPAAEGGLRFALRALAHRNYRLFFAGQSVSLVGTWLTRVATSWLVYRLSGSAAMLGLIGFCGLIPSFILSPLAGVYVDRHDRHRVIVITQVLSMLQSFVLAALALTDRKSTPLNSSHANISYAVFCLKKKKKKGTKLEDKQKKKKKRKKKKRRRSV